MRDPDRGSGRVSQRASRRGGQGRQRGQRRVPRRRRPRRIRRPRRRRRIRPPRRRRIRLLRRRGRKGRRRRPPLRRRRRGGKQTTKTTTTKENHSKTYHSVYSKCNHVRWEWTYSRRECSDSHRNDRWRQMQCADCKFNYTTTNGKVWTVSPQLLQPTSKLSGSLQLGLWNLNSTPNSPVAPCRPCCQIEQHVPRVTTSLLMSCPPINILHRLFRCRYSNSRTQLQALLPFPASPPERP